MDNIAVEAYALSCILPLVAFILLAFQFYRQSTPAHHQNTPIPRYLEEVPSHMGGLISITADIQTQQNSSTQPCKENQRSEGADGWQDPL